MKRDTTRIPHRQPVTRSAPRGLVSATDQRATPHPLEAVIDTATAALHRGDWEAALRGCVQVRATLKALTPPAVLGMGATCLHRLGRYEEADAMVSEGLGEAASQLTIPPVYTEAELLARWQQTSTPVISIVCTAFNHERYIEQTLRGFLAQRTTYPFEILIHDDASTDGTPSIIRRWQAEYPTIIHTVLQTENQLSQGNRPFELLLARARGRFIAACEGDDFWIDASKLQRQVSFLEANPDFSCTAHNYLHFHESALTIRPWLATREDLVMSQRQLMGIARLLWIPTLVFRKLFTAFPPERKLCAYGDAMLTSYLGTFGKCLYLDSMISSVRRENAFSYWSPLSADAKEEGRVKTWLALIDMHTRLGNAQAIVDLLGKVSASSLDEKRKSVMLNELINRQPLLLGAA